MKIQFSSWKKIEVLQNDVKELKKEWEPPCEFEPIFEKIDFPKNISEFAYCSIELEKEKGHAVIVAAPMYFDIRNAKLRKLILLHELIHACQRKNDLHEFNKKFLTRMDRLDTIIENEYKEFKDNFEFNEKIRDIKQFSTWIFEIWDELFLKHNYPSDEEEKHGITLGVIRRDCKEDAFKTLGKWRKYSVFKHMVRASYLKKITSGREISSEYEKLELCWKEILEKCSTKNELEELLQKLNDLTFVNEFNENGLSKLENAYDEMIEEMISNLKY